MKYAQAARRLRAYRRQIGAIRTRMRTVQRAVEPQPVQDQQRFARSRGWRFPMVSHAGTTFAADMGYRTRAGWRPGISAFQRGTTGIVRVSDTSLSPGDDFCALWHVLDLLPEGPAGWQPRLRYPAGGAEGRLGTGSRREPGASKPRNDRDRSVADHGRA
jgi:predicted dithiol-disulfide oxidoreductase (DUF899 family)